MTTREDKDYFIRLWNESFHMNNLGCGTPLYTVIIVGVLFLLCSCATKKKFIENEHVKTEIRNDSINTKVVQEDSTGTFQKTEKNEKEVINTDKKVEKSDSTVTTVDTNGNIIKQETWHKEKETVSRNREYEKCLKDSIDRIKHEKDSLLTYVAKCDSLQEKLLHKEYITVEKQKIPKWCYGSLVVCFLFIIFAIIKFCRKLW
jgi:hypothetical protein